MSLLSFAVGLFIVFNAVRFSLWYRRSTLLEPAPDGLRHAPVAAPSCWKPWPGACSARCSVSVSASCWPTLLLPGFGASLQSLLRRRWSR